MQTCVKAPGAFLMWERVCSRQGADDWHAAAALPLPLPMAEQTLGGGSAPWPGVSQPKDIATGGHGPWFTDREGGQQRFAYCSREK